MAKAPVPGLVKTRLGAQVGDDEAAELAAASLLDTLVVCARTFETCILALSGELDSSVMVERTKQHLTGWTIFPQRGRGLAERLENAHHDAFAAVGTAVVQVGMDTPHMTPMLLQGVADPLSSGDADAVMGPAYDGGWWVLGLSHPRWVRGLRSVPMSHPQTAQWTRRCLLGNGARVVEARRLRDVDTVEDAESLRAETMDTHFGRTWRQLSNANPS
jgi:hypothetical protein